jgi:RNA polymerase sigma-70 factor, ECF subfamily
MSSGSEQFGGRLHDQQEFHCLFVQNQRRIFAHILTLIPRLADAEEVFQQTCVVILSKAAQFAPGTDFVRWARQIAQYEVFNYRRRLQAERLQFNDDLLAKIAACRVERSDWLDAELDAMRECMELLSTVDRHLIRQRYAKKITSRALAVELGRPANTVYKALHRIRLKLRECIQRTVSREAHADGASDSPASEDFSDAPARPPEDPRNESGLPFGEDPP